MPFGSHSGSACLVDRDGALLEQQCNPRLPSTLQPVPRRESSVGRFYASARGVEWGRASRSWDPWITADAHGHRVYFLTCGNRKANEEWWARSQLATAYSSQALQRWHTVQMVVIEHVDYSTHRVLAGHAQWSGGRYFLLFTTGQVGSRREDPIELAVSNDGIYFTKHPHWTPIEPAAQLYHIGTPGNKWEYLGWRDPFIFHETDQTSWLIWAASTPRQHGSSSWKTCWKEGCHQTQYQGCIALAKLQQPLDQLNGHQEAWQLHPPLLAPTVNSNHRREDAQVVSGLQGAFWEMERPQLLLQGGRYHLFFNCYSWLVNPDWLASYTAGRAPDSSAVYHFVSDSLPGHEWQPASPPIVRGSEGTGLYGVHFVKVNSQQHSVFGWFRGEISLELSGSFLLEWQNGVPLIHRKGKAQ